jgi:hypothetical protein
VKTAKVFRYFITFIILPLPFTNIRQHDNAGHHRSGEIRDRGAAFAAGSSVKAANINNIRNTKISQE